MASSQSGQRITTLQWLVLAFFTLAFVSEVNTYTQPASWVIRHNQILNWQYNYLFLPIILSFLGLYGLYRITKFDKKGFIFLYIGFANSAVFDFFRGSTLKNGLLITAGNAILFLVFYFSTQSICKASQLKKTQT